MRNTNDTSMTNGIKIGSHNCPIIAFGLAPKKRTTCCADQYSEVDDENDEFETPVSEVYIPQGWKAVHGGGVVSDKEVVSVVETFPITEDGTDHPVGWKVRGSGRGLVTAYAIALLDPFDTVEVKVGSVSGTPAAEASVENGFTMVGGGGFYNTFQETNPQTTLRNFPSSITTWKYQVSELSDQGVTAFAIGMRSKSGMSFNVRIINRTSTPGSGELDILALEGSSIVSGGCQSLDRFASTDIKPNGDTFKSTFRQQQAQVKCSALELESAEYVESAFVLEQLEMTTNLTRTRARANRVSAEANGRCEVPE